MTLVEILFKRCQPAADADPATPAAVGALSRTGVHFEELACLAILACASQVPALATLSGYERRRLPDAILQALLLIEAQGLDATRPLLEARLRELLACRAPTLAPLSSATIARAALALAISDLLPVPRNPIALGDLPRRPLRPASLPRTAPAGSTAR